MTAPLLARKKGIQVSLETTKGTLEAPASDLFVFDPKMDPDTAFEERKGSSLYLGHTAAGVLGEKIGVCTFSAELRGTGSGGLNATLAILLQACGMLKTSEVYTPTSVHASQKTVSIAMWQDGRKKCIVGACGTFKLHSVYGKRVMLDFTFRGKWQAPIDEAMPAFSFSTEPAIKMDAAASTFTLGGSSVLVSKFELDMGIDVQPRPDIAAAAGIAYFHAADRDVTLAIDPEADTVASEDFYGEWLAGTEKAVSLEIVGVDDTFTFAIPALQYRQLPDTEREGILAHDITGQCNASSGDDEVTLTVTATA